MRLWLALLIAPALGGLVGAATSGVIAALEAPGLHTTFSPLQLFFGQTIFSYPSTAAVCYVVMWTFGLVWHFFMRLIGLTSVHAYWSAGGIIGLAVIILVGIVTAGKGTSLIDIVDDVGRYAPFGGISGVATGLAAWLIRRPDLPL